MSGYDVNLHFKKIRLIQNSVLMYKKDYIKI